MRAGKLDRRITIERATVTQDDYGATQETWATLATVRAELLQSTAREFMQAFGAASQAAVVFRIRWLDGITLADRVTYDARAYDVKEIKEIGRRKGLELRCIAQP